MLRPPRRRCRTALLALAKDDYLARIYLGLTLARLGNRDAALKEIEAGMKALYDWLENINKAKPYTPYWDPNREIRSALQKTLKMIAGRDIDWPMLISTAEWLGNRMEEEIDRVKRDVHLHYRKDMFGPHPGG